MAIITRDHLDRYVVRDHTGIVLAVRVLYLDALSALADVLQERTPRPSLNVSPVRQAR